MARSLLYLNPQEEPSRHSGTVECASTDHIAYTTRPRPPPGKGRGARGVLQGSRKPRACAPSPQPPCEVGGGLRLFVFGGGEGRSFGKTKPGSNLLGKLRPKAEVWGWGGELGSRDPRKLGSSETGRGPVSNLKSQGSERGLVGLGVTGLQGGWSGRGIPGDVSHAIADGTHRLKGKKN